MRGQLRHWYHINALAGNGGEIDITTSTAAAADTLTTSAAVSATGAGTGNGGNISLTNNSTGLLSVASTQCSAPELVHRGRDIGRNRDDNSCRCSQQERLKTITAAGGTAPLGANLVTSSVAGSGCASICNRHHHYWSSDRYCLGQLLSYAPALGRSLTCITPTVRVREQ